MNRLILLFAALAMSAALWGCGSAIQQNDFLEEQTRTACNNLQNGGCFAANGQFLFCVEKSGANLNITKYRLDNFSPVAVYSVKSQPATPGRLSCIGNVLFYHAGDDTAASFALSTAMDWHIELPFRQYVPSERYVYVFDESYFGSPGIYRIATENILRGRAGDKSLYTKISDLRASAVIWQGKYLYVLSAEQADTALWRMDLNGSNPVQIPDLVPEMLLAAKGRIYAASADGSLYSMSLDGSDRVRMKAVSLDSTCVNLSGSYIFYRHAPSGTIHRINADGTADRQLSLHSSDSIQIAGDWILYRNLEDGQYYKMQFDGSALSLVAERPDFTEAEKEIV